MNKTPTCPRCKVLMVARKGRHGDFFGCSNYPECKFSSSKRFFAGPENKEDFLDNVLPGDFNTRKG